MFSVRGGVIIARFWPLWLAWQFDNQSGTFFGFNNADVHCDYHFAGFNDAYGCYALVALRRGRSCDGLSGLTRFSINNTTKRRIDTGLISAIIICLPLEPVQHIGV